MNDLRLFDFDIREQNNINHQASMHLQVLKTRQCDMCMNLHKEQKHIFGFIMKYTIEIKFNKIYNLIESSPFFIFLGAGTGVGKSYLVTSIT